jgi:hypothetical protein
MTLEELRNTLQPRASHFAHLEHDDYLVLAGIDPEWFGFERAEFAALSTVRDLLGRIEASRSAI